MWASGLSHCLERFAGVRQLYRQARSGGVGAFTVDSFPVFDYMQPNVFVAADSNHGYKMIAVGREIARVLRGEHSTLLSPFIGSLQHRRVDPVSHSPTPGASAHLATIGGWRCSSATSPLGPQWDPSRSMEEQADWLAHASFMDGLVDEASSSSAGRSPTRSSVAHAVEAESEEAIRATLARDPWSDTHLVIDSIEPWTIRLDGRRR